MKKFTKAILVLCVIFYACQDEPVSDAEATLKETELTLEDEILASDGEVDETLVLNEESEIILSRSSKSGISDEGSQARGEYYPKLISECKVIDADRSCNNQVAANFWWPVDPTDYDDYYFSSSDDHTLTFSEYSDGTANVKGSTIRGTCVVEIDVWFKDKKDWNAWSAGGGTVKPEGCNVDSLVKEDLHFYVIDSSRSTITSSGDCGEGRVGTFGVEQRPDPNDPETPNLGVIIGPGGALWNTNADDHGLATWGWLTDIDTKERLSIMDFNFTLDCSEECKPCKGDVEELTLEYDWYKKKRVKIYQKRENTCYGTKIFDKVLEPGETFTINGANRDGSFGKYIYIYIGNRCYYYTKIKTNCYVKIGPGYTKGIFNVLGGRSTEGGELCEYEKPDYKCYRHWSCKYYSKCRWGWSWHH